MESDNKDNGMEEKEIVVRCTNAPVGDNAQATPAEQSGNVSNLQSPNEIDIMDPPTFSSDEDKQNIPQTIFSEIFKFVGSQDLPDDVTMFCITKN